MNKAEQTGKSPIPLYVSVGILLLLIACYLWVPPFTDFMDRAWMMLTSDDEQKVKTWVQGFGWKGPLILILAMIAQMFLFVIPTILLMVVTILAYGPWWGSLIIIVAVFLASSTGYAIGKYVGHYFVQKLLGPKTEKKVSAFIGDFGFWAVFLARLNPIISNDAISFVGGVLRMGYWKFISATLLGIAPLTFFLAMYGKNTKDLQNGLLWGSLISLVLFALYVFYEKGYANR